jgi:cell division protein FtsZ
VATGIDQAAIAQIEPINFQARTEAIARPRVFAPLRSALAPVQPAAAAADVYDDPIQPPAAQANGFPEPIELWREVEESPTTEFVPPAPEQPVARVSRMPQIEDLPQVAQNQLRAMREAQGGAAPAPETRRRSLLEKLAAFGITRHEEEPAPAPAPAAAPAPVTPLHRPYVASPAQADLGRPQARQQPARQPVAAPNAHSRPAPRPAASEDDHLDIPAFLRRQQN